MIPRSCRPVAPKADEGGRRRIPFSQRIVSQFLSVGRGGGKFGKVSRPEMRFGRFAGFAGSWPDNGLPPRGGKFRFSIMTSTVTANGHTVVPKKLRDRFKIKPGATLDWWEDGDSIRVMKRAPAAKGSFLRALRRLGRVPAAPRDRRPVEYD